MTLISSGAELLVLIIGTGSLFGIKELEFLPVLLRMNRPNHWKDFLWRNHGRNGDIIC